MGELVFVLILSTIKAIVRWLLSARKVPLASFFAESDPYSDAAGIVLIIAPIVLFIKYLPQILGVIVGIFNH
jgi:hypothetical protein